MASFLLRRPLPPQRRYEVREEIMETSTPSSSYYAMVALSTIIAAYGLLADSPAVVIGAMLVAPLMGPIFGIALGLLTGEYPILWKAVASEVLGVAICIALGIGVGLLPWKLEFGAQIIARTQPTLYDLVVALAAGLAGAYAMVKERVSPTLPGVAIAVAVLPPLVTCGLCIAESQWQWAAGSFLLFLANFLAIEIAAAFLFTIFGMTEVPTREIVDFWDFFRKFAVSLAALALIGTFMTKTLLRLLDEQEFTRTVRRTLTEQFASSTGTYLSEVRVRENQGATDVIATVLTPSAFAPQEVKRLEDALQKKVEEEVHLIVRALLSQDTDRSGPVFVPEKERKSRVEAKQREQLISRVSDMISSHLQRMPGTLLRNVKTEDLPDHVLVTAEVATPRPITPSQVAAIEKTLQDVSEKPVKLVVRSAITRYADATSYLYTKKAQPPSKEQLRLEHQLQQALQDQIAATTEGAKLTDLQWSKDDGRIPVLAVACTPQIIDTEAVADIQATLREQIDPNIALTIRSHLGIEVGASGTPETPAAEEAEPPPG